MHPAARDSHSVCVYVYVCVCVCVCVCARARARACALEPPPSTRHTARSTARRLVACVTSKTEEEDYMEQIRLRPCDKHLHNGNRTALKDFISCTPLFILRTQVFWFVAGVDG